jgi:hypothetical protein
MKALDTLLVATLLVLLAACGVTSPPLPPSLHLPQPVADLKASRKGNTVTLTWTVPEQSTDSEPLRRHLGVTRICREVDPDEPTRCSRQIAQLTPNQLPAPKQDESGRKLPVQVTFTDTLAPELQQQNLFGRVRYAVETVNTNGRSAGLSNRVEVSIAPVASPPTDIAARVTSDAVELRFSPTPTYSGPPAARDQGSFIENYRVYRSTRDGTSFTALGFSVIEGGDMVFRDRGFEWATAYVYKVTPVSTTRERVEIEGEDSKPIEVFTHDSFPPAAPEGLQAVSSGTAREKFIDLTWAPNTESDLAGYHVYRRQQAGDWVRITKDLITTPAFRDSNVMPGRTYYYAVSAGDLRRNESAKSEEAGETVH